MIRSPASRPHRLPGHQLGERHLTDFKLIGPVFAAAAEAGANNISGPTWQLSENSQAEAQALTIAAANARAKAEALAAAKG